MRNILITICLVFLTAGCQSNEESIWNNTKCLDLTNNQEIRLLKEFNDSILQSKSYTRGSWGTLLSTVSADILGIEAGFQVSIKVAAYLTAMTGGTAGPASGIGVLATAGLIGAGSSYLAYKGCNLIIPPNNEYYDILLANLLANVTLINHDVKTFKQKTKDYNIDFIDFTKNTLETDFFLSTTELHDDIIHSTLNEVRTRADIKPYIPLEPSEIKYEIPYFSTTDVIDMNITVNNTLKTYYNTWDYENILQEMTSNELITKYAADVLTLFLDALHINDNQENLIDLIINRYSNTVINSPNLTNVDKNALLLSFITSKTSINLWKNKIKN